MCVAALLGACSGRLMRRTRHLFLVACCSTAHSTSQRTKSYCGKSRSYECYGWQTQQVRR
jgi:hypothetical protein